MISLYISTCSVKSHLVKDTGQVSNLVLKITLKITEVNQSNIISCEKYNTLKSTQLLRNSAVSSSGVALFPRVWYLQ